MSRERVPDVLCVLSGLHEYRPIDNSTLSFLHHLKKGIHAKLYEQFAIHLSS
jgi:hypothetical protein